MRQGGAATVALSLALAAGLAGAVPGGARAHDYKVGNLAIGHVWAPPPEEGAAGLPVYGPILNRGQATVRLLGASTPVAERARFRVVKDGKEEWPDAVALRPGRPLALAPWRAHIWLSGLKKTFGDGDSFDLTLDFGDAGSLTVKVVVENHAGH